MSDGTESSSQNTYSNTGVGDLTVSLDIFPVAGDTGSPSACALRHSSSGAIGVIGSIMPSVGHFDDRTVLEVDLTWDLSEAPTGTRGVTSFGEGDISITASPDDITNCIIMVGKVQSAPPVGHEAKTSHGEPQCSMYWLGSPPDNLLALQSFASAMMPHFQPFFNEPGATCRVFLRELSQGSRAWPCSMHSVIVDYDQSTAQEHDFTMIRTLNQGVVATWTRLDGEEDGSSNEWFQQDALTRRAAASRSPFVERPIDEIVSALCTTRRQRRQQHHRVTTRDWLREVAGWIGEETAAEKHLRDQKDGRIMDFADMGIDTAFGNSLQVCEQNVLEMGFDRESLDTGIVSGLLDGSRAQAAGLRNGDLIVRHSRIEACEWQYERTFEIVVEVGGEERSMEYWPRASRKVRSWQSVKKS
ncbi:Ketoreductase azaE [Purpureocillium lavendulum]|uniref:Ketoreductase azaE n=1 Tax=Purpureocillium lavendulum TaxID=1247861 RepID=A0AB34G848_9HYPO|nr:Ketoreductase azaE [Purpureocillium lavendulum]